MLTKLAASIGDGRQRGTRALVLAPTRELVLQIEENVKAYGKHLPLRVATVFGGVGEHPQITALRAGTHLIIACPGRLMDLMQRRYADFSNLEYLVLDEADRMLDMGFLPSIPPDRPLAAAETPDTVVLRHALQGDRNPHA
ncbi:MAG: DEAD/DEAH box helicase [Limisphaerales bacterium]